MSQPEELCQNCGAPRAAGYAACRFCKTPFVANVQTDAIPCPRCNTLNERGAQRCVQCQGWVVVQCVFCHALSPHNVPACARCGEAFAGAPQRFAERQRQQHLQQGLNIATQVGGVAASFLGAAAGAGLFSGHSHEYHEQNPYWGGGPHHHHHRQEDWDQGTGAGIAQNNDSGGGFFGSLFGGSSDSGDSGTGAGIASSDDSGSSGGGFFDSLMGGGDSGTGAGISSSDDSSSDSGGSFFGGDDS
jgi:hypothetical protein